MLSNVMALLSAASWPGPVQTWVWGRCWTLGSSSGAEGTCLPQERLTDGLEPEVAKGCPVGSSCSHSLIREKFYMPARQVGTLTPLGTSWEESTKNLHLRHLPLAQKPDHGDQGKIKEQCTENNQKPPPFPVVCPGRETVIREFAKGAAA